MSLDPAVAALMLASVGLRNTFARRATVIALYGERSISHAEACEAVPEVHRATVYRALGDITRAGLARRYAGEDCVWRWSPCEPPTP